MKLIIKKYNQITADGIYTVRASSCVIAQLYWADINGILSDWTSFAIIPLKASNGTGSFIYKGNRAIPQNATHILVRAVGEDLKITYEELFELEQNECNDCDESTLIRATVLSDLHTVNKVGTLNRALETVKGSDCLLLTGDLTNDGSDAEFNLLYKCINNIIPDMPFYQVNGNHDLLQNEVEYNSMFFKNINGVDIIGINACHKWDTIMPVTDMQLNMLDDFLKNSTAPYHIIMIHTPLTRNMPVRNGHLSRYINCDKKLQKLVDSYKNIIMSSGHTHLSPSLDSGNVYMDSEHNNIYINCGSIRPTELGHESLLAPKDWIDGNNVEIVLTENMIEIKMRQINQRKYISRGYYRFFKGEHYEDNYR